ncbi:IS66 family insertion sequence element accessory protein TnpA [Pelagibaculum spongiae]
MTKQQIWQQRIEQWQQSQLSQKQWCEQQQIKVEN